MLVQGCLLLLLLLLYEEVVLLLHGLLLLLLLQQQVHNHSLQLLSIQRGWLVPQKSTGGHPPCRATGTEGDRSCLYACGRLERCSHMVSKRIVWVCLGLLMISHVLELSSLWVHHSLLLLHQLLGGQSWRGEQLG